MSAVVMDAHTTSTLNAVNTDWRPSRRDARRALRRAVLTAAENNDGYVHVSDVRPLLPDWIAPCATGAYLAGLCAAGVLVNTDDTRPYGGSRTNGNSHKRAVVRRLVKPIPEP